MITGVLLEGREPYEAVDEFLEIDGLDMIKIAPYDLSQSFGVPGDIYNPTVIAAVEDICAKVAATDKVVGMFSRSPSVARPGPRPVHQHRRRLADSLPPRSSTGRARLASSEPWPIGSAPSAPVSVDVSYAQLDREPRDVPPEDLPV